LHFARRHGQTAPRVRFPRDLPRISRWLRRSCRLDAGADSGADSAAHKRQSAAAHPHAARCRAGRRAAIGSSLILEDNSALSSLAGLATLASVGGTVTIERNALDGAEVQAFLKRLGR